jgi:hypothetical protein
MLDPAEPRDDVDPVGHRIYRFDIADSCLQHVGGHCCSTQDPHSTSGTHCLHQGRGSNERASADVQREAQRCAQRWSITPTRPALSRKAISFSPSSISRIGAPSGASSEDSIAGSQYCRIRSPITVPGPMRVSSVRSIVVVIAPFKPLASRCKIDRLIMNIFAV